MARSQPSAKRTASPRPRTRLIGRGEDVASVRALVDEHRLVTLTGAGGSGKTRLAVAVADELSSDHADGATFVALQDATDEASVVTTLGRALGIREHPDRDPVENIVRWLRPREALLVLDNFEQVLGASHVIAALLEDAPGVRIVVTSRAPLRIDGEHEFQVEPLDADDASALFVERARAVRAIVSIDGADLEAIRAITRRLDGLPLAIELAAAQVRLLSPAAILDRIERRLPVLEGGQRDAPDRHRTQRATLDWSHDLLDEPVQRLFARLSVFAGGWTLDAAERVCDPRSELDIAVYAGVASLVEQNLVRSHPDADSGPRFDMHQLIREYATERLDEASDAVGVTRAHAGWVLDLVETAEPELVTSNLKRWHRTLLADEDNIRASLRWSIDEREADIGQRIAAACWRFWHYWGRAREGRDWLEAVLALPDASVPSESRARALYALGWLRMWQQRVDDAIEPFEGSAEIRRALGHRREVAIVMDDAALAAFQGGDIDRGHRLIRRRWRDYPEMLWRGAAVDEESSLAFFDYFATGIGDFETIIAPLSQALSLVRRQDRPLAEAELLGSECYMHGHAGRYGESRKYGREALRAWLEIGHIGQLGFHLTMLSTAEFGLGNIVRAVRLSAAGERQHRDLGGIRTQPPPTMGHPMETAASLLGAVDYSRAVAEGEAMTLDEAVAYALSDRDGAPTTGRRRQRDPSALTPREREVLDLLVGGRRDGEIAETLFISPKTASAHVSNIKGKLGADSRVEIVTIALRRGIAEVDD
jgi:predicted ATPase/DNA-binding CsgD family transcriptional regulator